MEETNFKFVDYFFLPLHCCGAWSVGVFLLYVLAGAALFGLFLGASIRVAMRLSGAPVSNAVYKRFTIAIWELNRAAFSQNATTIVFAIITLPLVFYRPIENRYKIYFLGTMSLVFFIYAWFAAKDRTEQVYSLLNSKIDYVYVCVYYIFVLILMSSVLFSGPEGTVGMLRGRWYGALYIFFPVATAIVARLATYAIYKHDN